MAAISYHGTAFINIDSQIHDEVFFVEDLAHQCGHIIFYALTLNTKTFLKSHKDSLLREWTGVLQDNRSVYGAFHGLFTYTTILYCLRQCLKANAFDSIQQVEAMARIGFFMQKFEMDLNQMNIPDLFTIYGGHIYDAAFTCFEQVKAEYAESYKDYTYTNQPYIFNYEAFQQANSLPHENFNTPL